jgi:hypothetical protein
MLIVAASDNEVRLGLPGAVENGFGDRA